MINNTALKSLIRIYKQNIYSILLIQLKLNSEIKVKVAAGKHISLFVLYKVLFASSPQAAGKHVSTRVRDWVRVRGWVRV